MRKLNKYLIAIILLIYFIIGYNVIANLPRYASIEASTYFDDYVPLVPFFIVFYFLGYFFVFVPLYLVRKKKEIYRLGIVYFLIMSLSFAMFIFLPFQIKKEYALGNDFFSKITFFQQTIDNELNAFPSLHVALNLFSFLFVNDKSRKAGKIFTPIIILIISSTLFVKQHLLIDVIGGVAMTLIFFKFYKNHQ